MKKRNKTLLGVAVNGILAASAVAMLMNSSVNAQEKPATGSEKVSCYGINACKGKGECGGKGHDCGGKNACKGQGLIKTTKEDCAKKGGKLTEATTEK